MSQLGVQTAALFCTPIFIVVALSVIAMVSWAFTTVTSNYCPSKMFTRPSPIGVVWLHARATTTTITTAAISCMYVCVSTWTLPTSRRAGMTAWRSVRWFITSDQSRSTTVSWTRPTDDITSSLPLTRPSEYRRRTCHSLVTSNGRHSLQQHIRPNTAARSVHRELVEVNLSHGC